MGGGDNSYKGLGAKTKVNQNNVQHNFKNQSHNKSISH